MNRFFALAIAALALSSLGACGFLEPVDERASHLFELVDSGAEPKTGFIEPAVVCEGYSKAIRFHASNMNASTKVCIRTNESGRKDMKVIQLGGRLSTQSNTYNQFIDFGADGFADQRQLCYASVDIFKEPRLSCLDLDGRKYGTELRFLLSEFED